MKLLAIETSCDETGIALIEFKQSKNENKSNNQNKEFGTFKVLKNVLISQIDLHKEYGGVYPDLAKREHIKNIPILLKEVIGDESNFKNIDAIAVTSGPGLSPALWTGIEAAKAISREYNIPIYPINHMEGHIFASLLKLKNKKENKIISKNNSIETYEIIKAKMPAISLLISGGHTELIYMNDFFKYKKIGHTLDDAAGEAFDKVARTLGYDYPGGPEISRRAELARRETMPLRDELRLPRPMLHSHDLNFSFSGLKTSVINKVEKYKIQEGEKNTFCMEFENAVTDVLSKKTREAVYLYNAASLIVGGGVSANNNIRNSLRKICEIDGVDIYLGDKKNSTDNALMIAAIAFAKVQAGYTPLYSDLENHKNEQAKNIESIRAEPNMKL